MRDFTRSLIDFGWTLSVFGARQAGKLMDPASWRQESGAGTGLDAVTGALVGQLGANVRRAFDVGDRVQGQIVDALAGAAGAARPSGASLPILQAASSAGEEILVTMTRGRGRFSADRRYIALSNEILDLDGSSNGLHQGVWQALFSDPSALLARPKPPSGPFDEPLGPVREVPVSANTIARWTHADGSSISSVGPAASHLVPLADGSFLFLVITAQVITEGTGRFAGAAGLTQSLGATHLPAGHDLFAPDAPPTFPAVTLDTFKLIRPAEPGHPGAGGGKVAGAVPDLTDYRPAATTPAERVLVRSTRGRGRFSDDKRFITLSMRMSDPYGRADGTHEGVWQARFTDPRELLRRPPQPERAFDVPEGPVPALSPSANTKGIWSFADGSAIYAVGPAMSTLTQLADGSFLFLVATAQWITNGSGRFEGARGLKSSLGSTHIAAGVDLFGPEPVTFEATTIDTFRLVEGDRVGGGEPHEEAGR